jgi:hypothetical protein
MVYLSITVPGRKDFDKVLGQRQSDVILVSVAVAAETVAAVAAATGLKLSLVLL